MMEHLQTPSLASLGKNATTQEICTAVLEVRRSFPRWIRPAHEGETIGQQSIALAHALIDDVLRGAEHIPSDLQGSFVWFIPTLHKLKDTVSLVYTWSMPAKSYALQRLRDDMTILHKCLDMPEIPAEIAQRLRTQLQILDAVCTYFYHILFISYGHAPEHLPR